MSLNAFQGGGDGFKSLCGRHSFLLSGPQLEFEVTFLKPYVVLLISLDGSLWNVFLDCLGQRALGCIIEGIPLFEAP